MYATIFNRAVPLLLTGMLVPMAWAGEKPTTKGKHLFERYAPEMAQYITPMLDARYRYEWVDQVKKHDAKASTLRVRFGFETAEFAGFQLLVEGESNGILGNESFYDGVNGKHKWALVEDTDTTELNRLHIRYNQLPDTEITFGRQLINMGSEHFIGSQDWRQNQTTYDAVNIVNHTLPDTELEYAFITQQHNHLGSEPGGNIETTTHLLDIRYTGLPYATIAPYIYLIDDHEDASRSNLTAGVFAHGQYQLRDTLYFLHDVEFAHQSDYADNPHSFDLHYYRARAGFKWKQLIFRAGVDIAEGDGTTGLITHFADNHEFHGWEDKFVIIPTDGLKDHYLELRYKIKGTNSFVDGLKFRAQYHDFNAENSSVHYGQEWDMKIGKWLNQYSYAHLYYENYRADMFSKDTDKVIFQLGFVL